MTSFLLEMKTIDQIPTFDQVQTSDLTQLAMDQSQPKNYLFCFTLGFDYYPSHHQMVLLALNFKLSSSMDLHWPCFMHYLIIDSSLTVIRQLLEQLPSKDQ